MLDKETTDNLENHNDDGVVEYLKAVRDYFSRYAIDLTTIINNEPDEKLIELADTFVKAGREGKPIMKDVYENVKPYEEKAVEQKQSKYPNAERFLNNWEKVLRVKKDK